MLRFHTQTGGSTLTAQQPENNVVRVAIQALAAVLGGTQSLHTNSKDEALALPTEASVRIALRTQQILANESGVAETPDPLAGSYYVESLTNSIEEGVLAYIRRIDDLGGAVKAIEQGYIQQEIQDSAYAWQMDVEKDERIVVGLNKFKVEEESPKGLLRVDPSVGERQVAKLAKLKADRDGFATVKALYALERAARGEENLMPPILAAVKAYATLGEICDVLRKVFGEYRPSVMF
jgi:methylmalonyl-CoA mutase N-terminal domain/subunit